MARLPYVIPEQASPEVRQTFAQLPTLLNVFKMMANAETTFRPLVRLGSAILAQQKLSPKGGQNFAGVTTVCHMKRIEIAGFPAKTEDSEGARSGTLWYARVVPGNLVQGIRMEMETEAGQISAYLAEVQANGADLKLME